MCLATDSVTPNINLVDADSVQIHKHFYFVIGMLAKGKERDWGTGDVERRIGWGSGHGLRVFPLLAIYGKKCKSKLTSDVFLNMFRKHYCRWWMTSFWLPRSFTFSRAVTFSLGRSIVNLKVNGANIHYAPSSTQSKESWSHCIPLHSVSPWF